MRAFLTPLFITSAALFIAGCAGDRVAGKGNPDTLNNAISSPLYDINLLQTKIPPILLEALAAPYAIPESLTCKELAEIIRPLDEALGPDLDAPSTSADPSMLDRSEGAAYDLLGDTASSLIPLRGWVRKLTGSERRDRLVRAAIAAGGVRRAYLKGLGLQARCAPPAAPRANALKTPPPAPQTLPRNQSGPRFPTR